MFTIVDEITDIKYMFGWFYADDNSEEEQYFDTWIKDKDYKNGKFIITPRTKEFLLDEDYGAEKLIQNNCKIVSDDEFDKLKDIHLKNNKSKSFIQEPVWQDLYFTDNAIIMVTEFVKIMFQLGSSEK